MVEKFTPFEKKPSEHYLHMDRSALETLADEEGIDSAIITAQKAYKAISLFINQEIRPALGEASGEMIHHWKEEHARWNDKFKEIQAFITEHEDKLD